MGKSNKSKSQGSSLWTTTLEDIDKHFSFSEKEIKEAVKKVKDKKIDIYKPVPEVEELKKIFEPKYK